MSKDKRSPSPEENETSESEEVDENMEKDENVSSPEENESSDGEGEDDDASAEAIESGNEEENPEEEIQEEEEENQEEEDVEEEEANQEEEEENLEVENPEEGYPKKLNAEEENLEEEKREGKKSEAAGQKEVAVKEEKPEQAILKQIPRSTQANKGFPDFDALIFMCNSITMIDCFKYGVFGLPDHRKHTVEQIRKGMRLFLYNIDKRLLYGIFRAATPGGYILESDAFRNSKKFFPWQVRFFVYKDCLPLPEYVFREAIIDNYDENMRFKIELSGQQAQKLTKLFTPVAKGKSFLPKVPKPQPQIVAQDEYPVTHQSTLPDPTQEQKAPAEGRNSQIAVPKETEEHEVSAQVEGPVHGSPQEERRIVSSKTVENLSSLTSKQHMGDSWPENTLPKTSIQDQLVPPQFADRQDPAFTAHHRQVTNETWPLEEKSHLGHSRAGSSLLDVGLSLNSIRDHDTPAMNTSPAGSALYRSSLDVFKSDSYQIGAKDVFSLHQQRNSRSLPSLEVDPYQKRNSSGITSLEIDHYQRYSKDFFPLHQRWNLPGVPSLKADPYQRNSKDVFSLYERNPSSIPNLETDLYQRSSKEVFSVHQQRELLGVQSLEAISSQERNSKGVSGLDPDFYQQRNLNDALQLHQQRNSLGVLSLEAGLYQQRNSKDVLSLHRRQNLMGVASLEADTYQHRNSNDMSSLHQRDPSGVPSLGADPYLHRLSNDTSSLHQRNHLGVPSPVADTYQQQNSKGVVDVGMGSLYRQGLQSLSGVQADSQFRSYHYDPLANLPSNLAGVSSTGKRLYQDAFPNNYTTRPLSRQFMQEDYMNSYQRMHSYEERMGGTISNQYNRITPAVSFPGSLQYSRFPPPAGPYGRGLW